MPGFSTLGSTPLGALPDAGGTVRADLQLAYSVLAAVRADLQLDYAVLGIAQTVRADLALGYAVLTSARANLALGYQVLRAVRANFALSYEVMSETSYVRAPLGTGYRPRRVEQQQRPAAIQRNDR